jgi:fatty acid-binding protein DegV
MVVVHAARRAREGADEDTIISELEVVKKRVRTSCYVSNTDYLCKKGWVGKTANRVAKTLSLHPVMVLKRSRMKLGGFRVGDSERSIEKYVKSMLDTFNNIDKSMILVEYAGVDDDVLEHVKKCIKDNIKFEKIVIQKASSTIAANCGEGAVGLMYLMER